MAGRKSKLSEAQWADVRRRIVNGETVESVAKLYGLSKSSISEQTSRSVKNITATAARMVETEETLAKMSITEQMLSLNLASELRSISKHLASAAKFGAMTAHKLTAIAQNKVLQIDETTPLNAESVDALKGIAALTELANKSSHIGLSLLSASKDSLKAELQDSEPMPKRIAVQVVDASLAEP
ncbi:MAG: helix-turn-helix domain-containing protein [Casimicrobium sp.]